MAKIFNNLGDIIKSTAARKQRAAANRNSKSPENIEKPREVYLKFCEQLGNYYNDKGFKYLKSGPVLKKQSADKEWTLNIGFSSDYNNVGGEYVRLSFGNYIESLTLKKWTKSQPMFAYVPNGYVGGINTAKYVDPNANSALRWNLAQENDRENAFNEVTSLINNVVIPDFIRFKKPKDLLTDYSNSKDWTSVQTPMKYLLCFGTKEMAIIAGRQFLKSRPSIVDAYRIELEKLNQIPPPTNFIGGGYAFELARFSYEYALGDLSQ
jgi:hypothetical protein